MPLSADQSAPGSPHRVLDLVVSLVTAGNYRQARMHLTSLSARSGLGEVVEIVGQLTAPPAGVDPRTEAQARTNVPDALPAWLSGPVNEEIARICARQSIREPSVTQVIARILAASVVDASAPGHDELGQVIAGRGLHVPDVHQVVDVTDDRAPVAAESRPDRSITDWLGRRI